MNGLLKNKQIQYLFLSSFAVLFVGMGLFPILPLYATRFGANSSMIGAFLAIVFLANALGPMTAGWLAGRISRRALIVIAGTAGIPALLLMSVANRFWQVVLLTSVLWFTGGLIMTLVGILTGQQVDASNRGKAFSIIAMAAPLGALIGGAAVGKLVAWQGYERMFAALNIVWIVIPLIGLFLLKDQGAAPAQSQTTWQTSVNASRSRTFTRTYYALLAVSLLAAMAINVSRLATSLSMQSLQYSVEDVSQANMFGGLAAIPMTLTIGIFADRLGAKRFLMAGILFILLGSVMLINAGQLWQFWLAAALQMLAFSVNGSMGQAISTQINDPANQSRGISWLNTTMSTANIICFAAGGIMIDALGLNAVFLTAAIMAVAAAAGLHSLIQLGKPATSQPASCVQFDRNLREATCS